MKKFAKVYSGIMLFFVMIASTAAVCIAVFVPIYEKSDSLASAVIALFCVVLMLSVAFYAIGNARRKREVDEPSSLILAAAERLSRGDFSTRIKLDPNRDFGAFSQIAEHFNRMAQELSQMEILHSDFVADVSHEIKTPLAIVKNCAEMLSLPSLDDAEKAKYTETLIAAANRLTGLVSNILKLNKLEHREIFAKKRRFDLSEAVAECVVAIEERAADKGVELVCDFADGAEIVSDRELLDLIWNNLLSNAVKFTDGGGKIAVSVKVGGSAAMVTVSDTGCGMSEETGRRIFDKFWQGDTSHSKEGNGLGLALVKKVIDIVGGNITVDSALGKGSTFAVTLQRNLNDVAQAD